MKTKYLKIQQPTWDGILYPVNHYKDKIVIVVSGSDGGLEHASKHARYLAGHGIPSLALALFKTKHTGKYLNEVPIERVKEVIQYLKSQDYQKIAMDGTSKGCEYTFACALEYPDISCVIVKTPSYFYSEGLIKGKPSRACCWSKENKSLPYTPYKENNKSVFRMILENKEFNILEMNTGKTIVPASIIPINKLNIPILMFSTKVDTVWPSYDSCLTMMKTLEQHQYKYPYKHIAFEHMSHMMLEYCGKEIKYFIKSEKEDPEACYKERDIMGEETMKWLKEVWE